MTDAEKAEILRSAIERADRKLEWILGDPRHSEWMLTTAKHVRNILRAALKRTADGAQAAQAPGQALDCGSSADVPSAERKAPQAVTLPKVKLGKRALQFMKQDGILKEAKRK